MQIGIQNPLTSDLWIPHLRQYGERRLYIKYIPVENYFPCLYCCVYVILSLNSLVIARSFTFG